MLTRRKILALMAHLPLVPLLVKSQTTKSDDHHSTGGECTFEHCGGRIDTLTFHSVGAVEGRRFDARRAYTPVYRDGYWSLIELEACP